MKKLSIIIPCYNVEKYILKCLKSIVAQNYPTLEIICVNDGSTDKTLEILEDFCASTYPIFIVDQPNKGVAESRNRGLDMITGDYVMFIDGDDWLENNAFKELNIAHQRDDIVFFSYFRAFVNTAIPKDFGKSGLFGAENIQRRIIGLLDSEFSEISGLDCFCTCWGKIYKREILKEVYFKDLHILGTWEDGVFNIEALQNAKEVRIINTPYYYYRKENENSITNNYKKDLYLKWKDKYRWILEFNDQHNKPEDFNNALKNRICLTVINLIFNEMYSKESWWEKKKQIDKILHDSLMVDAFSSFNLIKVPYKYRIFYFFAKEKYSLPLLVIGGITHLYLKRR